MRCVGGVQSSLTHAGEREAGRSSLASDGHADATTARTRAYSLISVAVVVQDSAISLSSSCLPLPVTLSFFLTSDPILRISFAVAVPTSAAGPRSCRNSVIQAVEPSPVHICMKLVCIPELRSEPIALLVFARLLGSATCAACPDVSTLSGRLVCRRRRRSDASWTVERPYRPRAGRDREYSR